MALLGVGHELGEAEVGDLGLEVVVKEDVGGLDVAVDDRWVSELVQVGKPSGRAKRDPQPLLPVQVRELAELADAAAQCSLQADARQPPAKTRDIHGTISEEGPSHDIGGRRRRRWL
uniref:DUF834 domain-containing protein n=1 Tax=Oryza meridionalis TaxID=40149 RepID=A0A0E0DT84_9ORYZ